MFSQMSNALVRGRSQQGSKGLKLERTRKEFKQARKLQDAQAEKLTSLKAQKLKS